MGKMRFGVSGALLAAGLAVVAAAPAQAQACPDQVVVRSGDTLGGIARACGTTVRAIMAYNHGVYPDRIYPGMALTIPGGYRQAPRPPGEHRYVVQPGDTLSNIAGRFGVEVAAIISMNPGVNVQRIHAGQTLRVPRGR